MANGAAPPPVFVTSPTGAGLAAGGAGAMGGITDLIRDLALQNITNQQRAKEQAQKEALQQVLMEQRLGAQAQEAEKDRALQRELAQQRLAAERQRLKQESQAFRDRRGAEEAIARVVGAEGLRLLDPALVDKAFQEKGLTGIRGELDSLQQDLDLDSQVSQILDRVVTDKGKINLRLARQFVPGLTERDRPVIESIARLSDPRERASKYRQLQAELQARPAPVEDKGPGIFARLGGALFGAPAPQQLDEVLSQQEVASLRQPPFRLGP